MASLLYPGNNGKQNNGEYNANQCVSKRVSTATQVCETHPKLGIHEVFTSNFLGAQDIQFSVSTLICRIWSKLGIGLGPGPMNVHNSAPLGVFGGEDHEYRHPGSRGLLAARQWDAFRFPVMGLIWRFQKMALVLHQNSSHTAKLGSSVFTGELRVAPKDFSKQLSWKRKMMLEAIIDSLDLYSEIDRKKGVVATRITWSWRLSKSNDLPALEAGSTACSAEDPKATGAQGYLQLVKGRLKHVAH
ncbi:hypothetical protein B0H14DRAFT_3607274 [Mycena olivaceomarginata]|nr:hypothetical protein B0H14DRAFT_3607274 [Mycena olivaceomarginata]